MNTVSVTVPGLPAAELGGPSTMWKEFLRTDGRDRGTFSLLIWSSLYMEIRRPGSSFFTLATPYNMAVVR